jgi:hypothetical protein
LASNQGFTDQQKVVIKNAYLKLMTKILAFSKKEQVLWDLLSRAAPSLVVVN